MQVRDLLSILDIGSSVAEFDKELHNYFVETEIYRDFINDKYDIVSGDKGSGKTAIFRIVKERYRAIPEIEDVELIAGFNDTGNPVFQRLSQSKRLKEGQYRTVWKNYIVALLGNYTLDVCEGSYTDSMEELERILRALDLRTHDATAGTVFSKISNILKSAEMQISVTEYGLPIVVPKVEFTQVVKQQVDQGYIVESDDALRILNDCINDLGIRMWMVLDRLDEAFAGFPDLEIPALRALLRTYLDMNDYESIRLKLFVRNDLFRKIIGQQFVNLTHVNARRRDITWNSDDLYSLLCQRLRRCKPFMEAIEETGEIGDIELVGRIFPAQVDVGEKKPTSWNWILARIRDGNDSISPRNLIDLVNKAKEFQLRREQREPREYNEKNPLIEAESIRRAFVAVSEMRVQDTLLAESEFLSPYIEAFRNGKAEHNDGTIMEVMGELYDSVAVGAIEELKQLDTRINRSILALQR